jgi:putative addiction module killer protein
MAAAVKLLEYRDAAGRNRFRTWFGSLDDATQDKVDSRLLRLCAGNPGDIAPVGEGVSELRIHSGPGYRVYVAFDGQMTVILLGGGSKRTQARDIAAAKTAWADYKTRKAKR